MQKITGRWFGVWLILFLLFFFLCSCSEAKETVTLNEMRLKMESADPMLPEDLIVEETNDSIRSFSAGDDAFEIDLISLKNQSESEARLLLQNRLNLWKKKASPYDLSKLVQISRAEIFRKGDYLVLIMTSSNREIKKAFLDCFYR